MDVTAAAADFSWGGFAETLLATVAGAVFALAGAFVLFRVEREATRNDALTAAVERFVSVTATWFAERGEAFRRDSRDGVPAGTVPDRPSLEPFFAALEGVRLKCSRKEQSVVLAYAPALRPLLLLDDREQGMQANALAELLVKWRLGVSTKETTAAAVAWASTTVQYAERTQAMRRGEFDDGVPPLP